MTRSPPRALYAAGLLTALTGALLVAWFVSGWAEVRGRQRQVRDAPRVAAEQRGAELAHELRAELGAVMAHEVERPYFHYQNLFHDPLASAGPSVAPSPLAHGPEDALVLGYFQLDTHGRTTTPTINDDLPELSEPRRLADHRRFRDEVTRSLAAALAPPRAAGPLVAELAPPPVKPYLEQGAPRRQPRTASPASPPPVRAQAQQAEPAPAPPARIDEPAQVAAQANDQPQVQDRAAALDQQQAQAQAARAPQSQTKQQAQVVTLDRDAYLQNNWSNSVYLNQRRAPPRQDVVPRGGPPQAAQQPVAQQPAAQQPAAQQPAAQQPTAQQPTAQQPAAQQPAAQQPAAQQQLAQQQLAQQQLAQQQLAQQQLAQQQLAQQPAPQQQLAQQQVAQQQVAQQQVAQQQLAQQQLAQQQLAQQQAAQQQAEASQAPPRQAVPPQVTPGPVRDTPESATTLPQQAAVPHAPRRPVAQRLVAPAPSRDTPAVANQAARASIPEPAQPIAITVSPLEWRTLAFAGQPAIVAARQVETPDGRLVQGFVIDRTALTGWLAAHAGDAVAELRTGDNGSTEIVPGWHLEVAANPLAITAAAGDAAAVARGFVLRFIAVGLIATLVALLVVMLVVRAERLARERSQFAAAAAHELRTPLAGLQLYGDMLADGLGDPGKLRDYARRMSEEASRLGRVVSNVLGFSQLERGNLSVDARPGALGDALCELAERAQPALDRAGAVLALEVAPELSATFDRDALARIVGNLLDNAEKYGRQAGDRTITLAARAAGPMVEIVISDRGPGIAPSARARLFQPFSRGVSGDGPAGLGLGLALSQSLARAMGGELGYRPVPDGGAAFVLTLARG